MTESEKIVIATNKFIELVIEGAGCVAQMETFANVHMYRVEESSPYEFLFFAKEWFDTRGFSTTVRPTGRVKGFERLLIKLSLYMLRRRSVR